MIANIEKHLDAHYEGCWRRLLQSELDATPYRGARYGWHVEIASATLRIGCVDYLVLVIDASFPNSQPTVFAPQAGSHFRWPHVEGDTRLCLIATRCAAEPGLRVVDHLAAARELLSYSNEQCREEFEREFIAYWRQRATITEERKHGLSIVAPNLPSREISCFFDSTSGRVIFGEDKHSLARWLRNSGLNPSDKEIFATWLLRLSQPWIPNDFPEVGQDVIKLLPPDIQRSVFVAGHRAALLLEVTTITGPGFAAVVLEGANAKVLSNGFRHISRVPVEYVIGSFAARPIKRLPVARADGSWIHGRDHNPVHLALMTKKVCIVGCGALGAAIAKLLAQTGVGEILLIDPDTLATANVGRHSLGVEYVGLNKAFALSAALRKAYPHLRFDSVFPRRFENLAGPDRKTLEGADLIVTAGINFDGEAALDAWRTSLARPPALVSSWAEAYANAGHAILLYGKTSMLLAFDESEQPIFRLTDWPIGAGTLIVEAGCGNAFQPHGVIDLHPTIGMAAGLVVDALIGKAPDSCRRYWLGDRSSVLAQGGVPRAEFSDSRVVREVAW